MLAIRNPKTEIVPAAKVKKLGNVGRAEFVTIGSDEFLLEEAAVDDPADLAEIKGARWISIPNLFTDERGMSMPIGNRYRRAVPVARGTYQRQLEKGERRSARPQVARRPADALDGLSLLRPRADSVWPATTASVQTLLPVAAATGAYVPGRRKVRGRMIVDHLESLGVTLEVHAGKLLVTSAHARTMAVGEVIERAGRLLLGWLTDRPVTCELRHTEDRPEAWTVLIGGLAACQPHADGLQS